MKRHPTILIVDDDPDVRDGMAEVIQQAGYKVASATNGKEALSYLEHCVRPALVLLDWQMPTMDGPEFLSRLTLEKDDHVCVVVISATRVGDGAAGHPEVVELLFKPFDIDVLLHVIGEKCRFPNDSRH